MSTDERKVSVSRDAACTPDVMWRLVTDLPRMGEWSPENRGGEWINATEPAVGVRFKGRNKNGKRNWNTTVEVIQCDEPRAFAFSLLVGKSKWCDWVYEIESTSTGVRVTHSWIDRRSKFTSWLGGVVSGVKDRASHNAANMEKTLDALIRAAN
ncbi:MAG: SRPBCC family protein [Ilumatobacteraceae bacterium]|jgi:hypothetical protein|nr:SRPBCC family protein [Ilumatobacteraceae bacterium]